MPQRVRLTQQSTAAGLVRSRLAYGHALRHAISFAVLLIAVLPVAATAQQAVPPPWKSDLETRRRIEPPATPPSQPAGPPAAPWGASTTVAPQAPVDASRPAAVASTKAAVTLSAFLTQDGEPIDQGLVWRVYSEVAGSDPTKPRLLGRYAEPSPVVSLDPGTYVVNAAYGRAHLTRKIAIPKPGPTEARFVLNAGGLRVVAALASGEKAPDMSVGYDVYQGDSDQLGGRTKIVAGVRPGIILRLNAGLYHIVSTLGDANAVVNADVTVEAGKLTDATVSHYATRVTLKLVQKTGGDAQADTLWAVHTAQGDLVREAQGALPSHILSAGQYVASARHGGKLYQREFTVAPGEPMRVEIVMP